MNETVEFICIPQRAVFCSDNFKVYGVSVNTSEYPQIILNKFCNATINGNFQDLEIGMEYSVKAKPSDYKGEVCYQVSNIKLNNLNNDTSKKEFLYSILTENQADALLSVYPNIVDMIMENEPVDLSKIKGIKEYSFEKIKTKIIENFKLAEIVEEYNDIFSLNIVKKIYDKYGNVEMVKQKLKDEPYEALCSLSGVGFKKADEMLLKLFPDLLNSYQRAKSCAEYLLLEEENSGNTFLKIKTFKERMEELVPECTLLMPKLLKETTSFTVSLDTESISRTTTFEVEKRIANLLNNAKGKSFAWDFDTTPFTKIDDFELTKEQCSVSERLCKNSITLLIGYGGSGKTSSTLATLQMLKYYKKTFLLVAPTGRAAKVLAGYTKEKAETIHTALGYNPSSDDESTVWAYNQNNTLPYDVVVLDEASMVDIYLFLHLLEAIDFSKTKLLIIGDDAQLPSVGAGNVLHDLIASNKFPTVVLNKIFRYGKGGLSTVATDTRKGFHYLKNKTGVQIFGEDKSYYFIETEQEKAILGIVALYKKLLENGYNPEDIGVLSSYNKYDYGTIAINKALQAAINPNSEFAYISFGNSKFAVGDIVINTINNRKAQIYSTEEDKKTNISFGYSEDNAPLTTFIANGEIGKIISIKDNRIIIDFDGLLIKYEKSDLSKLLLGYCISTHKSQGGQYKVVILLTPKAHTYMLTSNLLYVGISRAKEKCYHIGNVRAVNFALNKQANLDRNTLLPYFLNYYES